MSSVFFFVCFVFFCFFKMTEIKLFLTRVRALIGHGYHWSLPHLLIIPNFYAFIFLETLLLVHHHICSRNDQNSICQAIWKLNCGYIRELQTPLHLRTETTSWMRDEMSSRSTTTSSCPSLNSSWIVNTVAFEFLQYSGCLQYACNR